MTAPHEQPPLPPQPATPETVEQDLPGGDILEHLAWSGAESGDAVPRPERMSEADDVDVMYFGRVPSPITSGMHVWGYNHEQGVTKPYNNSGSRLVVPADVEAILESRGLPAGGLKDPGNDQSPDGVPTVLRYTSETGDPYTFVAFSSANGGRVFFVRGSVEAAAVLQQAEEKMPAIYGMVERDGGEPIDPDKPEVAIALDNAADPDQVAVSRAARSLRSADARTTVEVKRPTGHQVRTDMRAAILRAEALFSHNVAGRVLSAEEIARINDGVVQSLQQDVAAYADRSGIDRSIVDVLTTRFETYMQAGWHGAQESLMEEWGLDEATVYDPVVIRQRGEAVLGEPDPILEQLPHRAQSSGEQTASAATTGSPEDNWDEDGDPWDNPNSGNTSNAPAQPQAQLPPTQTSKPIVAGAAAPSGEPVADPVTVRNVIPPAPAEQAPAEESPMTRLMASARGRLAQLRAEFALAKANSATPQQVAANLIIQAARGARESVAHEKGRRRILAGAIASVAVAGVAALLIHSGQHDTAADTVANGVPPTPEGGAGGTAGDVVDSADAPLTGEAAAPAVPDAQSQPGMNHNTDNGYNANEPTNDDVQEVVPEQRPTAELGDYDSRTGAGTVDGLIEQQLRDSGINLDDLTEGQRERAINHFRPTVLEVNGLTLEDAARLQHDKVLQLMLPSEIEDYLDIEES